MAKIDEVSFSRLHETHGHLYSVPTDILLTAAKQMGFSHAHVTRNKKDEPLWVTFLNANTPNFMGVSGDTKWCEKIELFFSFKMTGKKELFVNTYSSIGMNAKNLAERLARTLNEQGVPARSTILKGSTGVGIDWGFLCDKMFL